MLTKVIQYRLVDSADVVAWVFSSPSSLSAIESESKSSEGKSWSNIDKWEQLNVTLKAIKLRISGAKNRLVTVQSRVDAKIATVSAGTSSLALLTSYSRAVEYRTCPDRIFDTLSVLIDAIDEDDPELAASLSQLETIETELSVTVAAIVKQFSILFERVTTSAGPDDEWESWWIIGWFREFCRSVRFLCFRPFLLACYVC